MHRKIYRKRRGHSIAELGPALFMVLLIMVLPIACLASLGIRYSLMFYAARQAAREAAKAQSFITDSSAYQRSAKNRASDVIQLFANGSGGNGLKLISITTYADAMNIGTGAVTTYGPSSPAPAGTVINTGTNVYNYRVQVDAEIAPLFNASGGVWYVGVPGLSKPFPVRIVCASMAEKPSGFLN